MKDYQFFSIIVAGALAIVLLFMAGMATNSMAVVKCALISAAFMYVCQMSDAVGSEMGSRYKLFYTLALASWVGSIVAWIMGFLILTFK